LIKIYVSYFFAEGFNNAEAGFRVSDNNHGKYFFGIKTLQNYSDCAIIYLVQQIKKVLQNKDFKFIVIIADKNNNNIRTTIVSPGSVATELYKSINNKENREAEIGIEKQIGLSAENIASSVVFAIDSPDNMDVNEVIIRPIKQDV